MPGDNKTAVRPEVKEAVVHLLKAEQEFLRAWGDWKVHAGDAPRRQRVDLAEKRLEKAQAAAIWWQAEDARGRK